MKCTPIDTLIPAFCPLAHSLTHSLAGVLTVEGWASSRLSRVVTLPH
jgi:hypothetical protein